MSVFRTPNEAAKSSAETEINLMLEEFAFSSGFKLFLNEIINPIVIEIRGRLLRVSEMDGTERNRLVARLDMLERILDDLYSRTADGKVPEPLQNYFR